MTQTLLNRIIDFLKPFMSGTQSERKALVETALYDSPSKDYIEWQGGALPFTQHLIHTIIDKGSADDICTLLNGLAVNRGVEQRAIARQLCDDWQQLSAEERKAATVKPLDALTLLPETDAIKHMPVSQSQVFISYRRANIDAVNKLIDQLRAEHYTPWIDREGIKLGDDDWLQVLQNGIASSAGVILCLSPEAIESPFINWEMRTAQQLNKPVFVVMLGKIDDFTSAYTRLSLPEHLQAEPMYDIATWETGFNELLKGLRDKGIRVTPHDMRKDRTRDEYTLQSPYQDSVDARCIHPCDPA